MTGCIFHDDNGVQCERDPGHKGKHAYDLAMGGQHQWMGGLVPAARIAELGRAAATSRAEGAAALAELSEETAAHELTREAVKAAVDEWNGVSAALGLATARIRELEGERDELLGLAKRPLIDGCHLTRWEEDSEGTGTVCASVTTCREHRRRAIVARIEKATKGTT